MMDNVHLLYNVSGVTDCQLLNGNGGGALFFYTELTTISREPTISSRQVVVGPLDMLRKRGRAGDKENEALDNIIRDEQLSQILELVQ